VAVMLLPVILDFTVMLLELAAVTTPMKSSMVSTLPGGIQDRTMVVAVMTFGWLKSTVIPLVVVMALRILKSNPTH
jgi:hypothetical protein